MKVKMPEGKFLGSVQMGDGGQIIMPKEVLEMFALKPGDCVTVMADKKKGIAIRRGAL